MITTTRQSMESGSTQERWILPAKDRGLVRSFHYVCMHDDQALHGVQFPVRVKESTEDCPVVAATDGPALLDSTAPS